MSASLVVNVIVVLLLGAAALRAGRRPERAPWLGWLLVILYLAACAAAFLVWGRDGEGMALAGLLVGMPWSFGIALLLSPVITIDALIAWPGGAAVATCALLLIMTLNARLLFLVGSRLPALWGGRAASPQP
ncbi:hypothetical protein F8S13_14415 [Chloroflexia bacterium SDU3-3]|nr:hypothetical protein F8S13_14415 [Chloroflexia bacterium SDU3-3]